MVSRTCRFIPAIAAMGAGALALAADPTVEDLKAQIDALQNKVEALEAQQAGAADVDATVARILADAESRSQLMASEGFTAGYNKGKFLIQSADGKFVLNPSLHYQFRYVANGRDEQKGNDMAIEDGFENRRLKLAFGGNAFTPKFKYDFVWGTERNGGGLVLEDAIVQYEFADHLSVKAGQFKDPVAHEELVSSKRQIAVDRSLLNEVLGGGATDRIQGIGLLWNNERVHTQVVFHDGANSDNTNFQNGPRYWGGSGRVEFLAIGDNWKATEDFTARGTKQDVLLLGAGADYTQAADVDTLYHALDAHFETGGGLSLYAAFIGQFVNPDVAANQWNYGFLGQVAYMLNERWELFGRYDVILLDEDGLPTGAEDTYHEFTAGVNYYIHGHNAKITADVVFLPDGSPKNESGIGILTTNDNASEVVGRVQFQLVL